MDGWSHGARRTPRALVCAGAFCALAGCGARSSALDAGDGGRFDVGVRLDAARDHARDRGRDRALPRDGPPADACLNLPAKEVTGTYSGNWKGTWRCGGPFDSPISGTLVFTLSPAGSPDDFKVVGTMKGHVDSDLSFVSSMKGTMSCTALVTQLPDVVVGDLLYLEGKTSATYVESTPPGFPKGAWSARETNGVCTGDGSWWAYRVP